MADRWVIYGATGFTGRLLVERAVARGLAPLLAGRDETRLRNVAVPLGLDWRAVPLDDPAALARLLAGSTLLLNSAGPFTATAGPLVAACLATGTHYLDVTGEMSVFAALESQDAKARRRRVMLLPGAGFAIVATDCLAVAAARRWPGGARLRLGIELQASLAARGSLWTFFSNLGSSVYVRHGGRLVELPRSRRERDFDYGRGSRTSLCVSSPDTLMAYRSTGIPDIEIYLRLSPPERAAVLGTRLLSGSPLLICAQPVLRALVDLWPKGPIPAERRQARCTVVAEVEDRAGCKRSLRLHTPDQYTFTADAAIAVVERVLAGDALPGFQTPALAYGGDFVLDLPGVTRENLAA